MKIQVVKCSDEDAWYKDYDFPIKTRVDSLNGELARDLNNDLFYHSSDCINDEEFIDDKPTKDSVGKLFYEIDWEFIEGMAKRMALNKKNGKYDVFGWRDKGVNIPEMNQALIRHLIAILKGELSDDTQDYSHYYALACNSMLIVNELERNRKDLINKIRNIKF